MPKGDRVRTPFPRSPKRKPKHRPASRHDAPENMDRTVYSEEERQFLAAVEKYQRTSGRRFPTHCEILKYVVKALGYRRPEFPD